MRRKGMLLVVTMVLVIGSFPTFGYGAPAKDEVLKAVIAQEPLTLDPTQFSSGNDRIVLENWGEFLLNRDTSGKVVPGLATSWKVSPDGKKIEFTLRKGVKFHSGDLFDRQRCSVQLGTGKGKKQRCQVGNGEGGEDRDRR